MAKKKNKNNHRQNNGKSNQNPIEALQSSLRKQIEVQHRDRTSSEYSREIKRLAEKNIQTTVSKLHGMKNGKNVIGKYKFDSAYQKRRISAISEYAPKAAELFEEKYPQLDIEETLARICSAPIVTLPDLLEEDNYLVLACAVFILDELYENRNLDEAILYIPSEKELISEIDLPEDYYDSCFEDDVIQGLMYLIVHRNDSEKYESSSDPFMNPVSVKRTAENIVPIKYERSRMFDDLDINIVSFRKEIRAAADKMTFRERFDKVMSFVRPAVIERAAGKYESKIWEYLDIILKGVKQYDDRRIESLGRSLKVTDEMLELVRKAEEHIFEEEIPIPKAPAGLRNSIADVGKITDIMNSVPHNSFSAAIPSLNGFSDYESDYEKDNERFHKCLERMSELEDEYHEICFQMEFFIDYSVGDGKDDSEFFAEVSDTCKNEFNNFRVDNPYEICFAVLYLLDSGNNLPWLCGPAGEVVLYAAELLPWTKDDNFALFDAMDERDSCYDNEEDDESESEDISTYLSRTKDESIKDNSEAEKEMYAPVYTDYCSWEEEGFRRVKKDDLLHLNFPQFIFSYTRVNIPRNVVPFENHIHGFRKSGFSPKHIDFLRMYLHLGDKMAFRKGFPAVEFDKPSEAEEKQTSEELKKVVADRNEEISRLKKELHKAESEAEQERKKAERAKDEYEADRQELIELRELVYKLQNSAENDTEEENTDISLPYNAKSRIVIYGGHASWLRAIKPLLPNVRFIEPSTNPDANLIRNADVVWMQANAMPHSFYNKIMEIARQRKIPVKYFAYASAEKCARQLAASEMQ